jgi:hypothetical protein
MVSVVRALKTVLEKSEMKRHKGLWAMRLD